MRLAIRGLGRFTAFSSGFARLQHNVTTTIPTGGVLGELLGGGDLGSDLRKFRLAKNGAVALVAGRLLQSSLPIADHANMAVAAAAVGATTITVTLGATAVVANQYAGGYVYVNDAGADVTTEGYMYRVQSHPAADLSTAVVLTLAADTPIKIALTANSQLTLLANPYSGVLVHASPPTANLVGVAPVAVAANAFFYVQVAGPCAVLQQGTLIIGDLCAPSATVDGAVMPSAALETDGPSVGRVMTVNADGEEAAIWLALG